MLGLISRRTRSLDFTSLQTPTYGEVLNYSTFECCSSLILARSLGSSMSSKFMTLEILPLIFLKTYLTVSVGSSELYFKLKSKQRGFKFEASAPGPR
jgi:hypothetical protein